MAFGSERAGTEISQMKMRKELKYKENFSQNMKFILNISIQLMQQIEVPLQSEMDIFMHSQECERLKSTVIL